MSAIRKPVSGHRRVVIKIGSALLVDRSSGLKADWLGSLCADIAALKAAGADVLVVSSGAIAMGRTVLGLPPARSGWRKARQRQPSARSHWRGPGRPACRSTQSSRARCC